MAVPFAMPIRSLNTILLLAPLLAVAVVSDVRRHRIPNWLCLVGLTAGLGVQYWLGGWHGAIQALLGACVGLLGFMPFYLLRAMGAGDVKLLAAVGSFLGPQGALVATALSLLVGGLGAFGFVLWRAFQSAAGTIVRGEFARLGASMYVAAMVARRERLPFALPIGVGSLAAWWQQTSCSFFDTCLKGVLT